MLKDSGLFKIFLHTNTHDNGDMALSTMLRHFIAFVFGAESSLVHSFLMAGTQLLNDMTIITIN